MSTEIIKGPLSASDIPGADTAYAHQVPTSDGAGGFTWEDQAGGTPTTDAGDLTSGTLAAARLPGVLANVDTQAELLSAAGAQAAATGTPNGSKYLRDDNSWQAVSATDSTKLPLAGGTMTGYITLGGAVAYNAANVGIGYHNAMCYLQNGTGWVRVNGGYLEFSRNLYFASQNALTSNINREIGFRTGGSYTNVPTGEAHDLLINGSSVVNAAVGAVTLTAPMCLSGAQTNPGATTTCVYNETGQRLILQSGTGSLARRNKMVTRVNSVAYSIEAMASGDKATAVLRDSLDREATAKISTSQVVTFEAGSHADYVASSSPASGEVGVYITGNILTIKPGSAGTRAISVDISRGVA